MLIHEKMGLILAEISAVGKNSRNDSQGYKFRSVDDVYNEVNRAMKMHGVFCLPEIRKIVFRQPIKSAKGHDGWHQILEIAYKFVASDGSHVEAVVWGESADFGSDKTTNKCMSIAHKYALFQIFMIPTVDLLDPDRESPLHDDMRQKEANRRSQYQQRNQQRQAPQKPPQQPPQQPAKVQADPVKVESEPTKLEKAEQELMSKIKRELISIIQLTPVDWKIYTKHPANELIAKIESETRIEMVQAMWQKIQKIIFTEKSPQPGEVEGQN